MDYRITRHAGLIRARRTSLCVAALLAGAALSGCRTRLWKTGAIEDMPPADMPLSSDMMLNETSCRQVRSNKIDLLFAIDNSKSMEPMQEELVSRMPQFLKVLFDLAAGGTSVDLHLGVITSDYGAGHIGGLGCEASPGGQGGRLQAVGAGAVAAGLDCQPPVGADYVKFQFGPGGVNNLPPNQDLAKTFGCMAAVGAEGCGMEHQLEAT